MAEKRAAAAWQLACTLPEAWYDWQAERVATFRSAIAALCAEHGRPTINVKAGIYWTPARDNVHADLGTREKRSEPYADFILGLLGG